MKFAVISTWPEVKNAEYEIVERIKIAAKNLGHECIVVDSDGRTLDKSREFITNKDVEFAISLHFLSPKLFGIYTYGAMWNPPQFLRDWNYPLMVSHILSYDDFLIYGSRVIDGHLDNLLAAMNKSLQGALAFAPSVPGNNYEPTLGKKKVFYSGINWERIGNKKGRHHDLFVLLDKTGYMEFYGPENFLGHKPWAGFKSFKGSLPFDGLSTIKAINQCGISLVITSNAHREAEAVTNRLYESCAAGAVIISDDNAFTVREFGDSVLTFKYSSDAKLNFQRIMEKIEWIENNPEHALALAKKSQQIYKEKFKLEGVLQRLISMHPTKRAENISRQCASQQDAVIDVLVISTERLTLAQVEHIVAQLNNQLYEKLNLIISVPDETYFPSALTDMLRQQLRDNLTYHIVYAASVLHSTSQTLTSGELTYAALPLLTAPYFTIYTFNADWDETHLSRLIKVFEDTPKCYVAYSGFISRLAEAREFYGINTQNVLHYQIANKTNMLHFTQDMPAFTLLFKQEVAKGSKLANLRLLDGFEHRYLAAFFLINALKLGDIRFSNAVSAIRYESQEETDLTKQRKQQIQYLNDAFMFDETVQELRALYTMEKSRHAYFAEPEHFKRQLKEYLLAEFNHHPRFIKAARRIYRLLRKPFS